MALGIVEVRGDGDDRFRGVPAAFANFLKNHRGEFFGRVFAVRDFDPQHLPPAVHFAFDDLVRDEFQFIFKIVQRPTHQPFHAEDRVFRIGQCPLFRGRSYQDRAIVMKANATRHQCRPALVAHDNRLPVPHVRGQTERGAEVNSNNRRIHNTPEKQGSVHSGL